MAARHAFARELTGKIVQEAVEVITAGDTEKFRGLALCASFGDEGPFHFGNLQALSRKTIIATAMSNSAPTRRWERMPVDLPVKVFTSKGFSTTVVEGRGTEISQGGMTLYAGILLSPGDLLEVEFGMPTASRMPAIVRSRNGFCFGLEFITPLPS
jgi:hypothetical protein